MTRLFEIAISKPDGREEFWHLADNANEIAQLLRDSIEAEQFGITIKPADLPSLSRLFKSQPDYAELCGQSLPHVKALVYHVLRACLPVWATQYPFEMFHFAYTEVKGQPYVYQSIGNCRN